MKQRFFIFLTGLMFIGIFSHELYAFGKRGTAAMDFLNIGANAAAVGRGGAVTSSVNNVNAIFWNPAGIAHMNNPGIGISYIQWIADINYIALAGAYPLEEWGVIGLNINYMSSPEMNVTDIATLEFGDFLSDGKRNLGRTGATFQWTDFALGVTFARFLTDKFNFGLHVQYIRESAESETYNTLSTDVGLQYDTGYRGVKFGAAIQNFGPDVQYFERAYPLPLLFRLGFSLDLLSSENSFWKESQIHKLILNVDGLHPKAWEEQVFVGTEYVYNNLIALRAGYRFNDDQESFSAGTGVSYSTGIPVWHLDFAYGDFGEFLDNSLRFSFGVDF